MGPLSLWFLSRRGGPTLGAARRWFAWLLLLPGLGSSPVARGQFATQVVSYAPGLGFATEWGTGAGYTNTAAALGEPSRITPGEFGGPVDPFNPPYLSSQLLSVGQGGAVTLALDLPVRNDPLHPWGLDFIIFGGAGLVITNGDYSGGGVSDGSLFGGGDAVTRVSVSPDGLSFYPLDPGLAPAVESGFPTDGRGDFTRPPGPTGRLSELAGLTLDGIRSRYAGSAGGTAYDLSWARDAAGRPVNLSGAAQVRVEVLSGRVEIDGVAAVQAVPEPSVWALGTAGLAGLAGVAVRRAGRAGRPS
ncbi:MAG: PEP-CTERM sorting domain-containing protein [Verrucomicrobiota bacterium]